MTTSLDPKPRSYASGGMLLAGASQLLFITAQVPEAADGSVPAGFEAQARLVWQNLLGVLAEAGMTERNLVRVGFYLADRAYREANSRIRHEMLGDGHQVAQTILITGIFDESWLLAIDAVAAA
jgi:enamine deaminase RidA (YjgF/YER057c/UK114 family)